MFKFIAKAYKTSWQALSGVQFTFGDDNLGIGPEIDAPVINAPSTKKLDMMGHNPHAIYALMLDFRNSPLRKKGVRFMVDDVEIRLGPQKDPIVIERAGRASAVPGV